MGRLRKSLPLHMDVMFDPGEDSPLVKECVIATKMKY
jgi:hypothetical protein